MLELLETNSINLGYSKLSLDILSQNLPKNDNRSIFKREFWKPSNDGSIRHGFVTTYRKMRLDLSEFKSIKLAIKKPGIEESYGKTKVLAILPHNNIDLFIDETIHKVQALYPYFSEIKISHNVGPALYCEDLNKYNEEIFKIEIPDNNFKTYQNPKKLRTLFRVDCLNKKIDHFKLQEWGEIP